MGAFISDGEVGVWASNRERDGMLDWFADHRCSAGDQRWQWCKSVAQRFPGRCIDLSEFLQAGELFHVTEIEESQAAEVYGASVAQLLTYIALIHSGKWVHKADSVEAVEWRKT